MLHTIQRTPGRQTPKIDQQHPLAYIILGCQTRKQILIVIFSVKHVLFTCLGIWNIVDIILELKV
jgi:hypothetical protein